METRPMFTPLNTTGDPTSSPLMDSEKYITTSLLVSAIIFSDTNIPTVARNKVIPQTINKPISLLLGFLRMFAAPSG